MTGSSTAEAPQQIRNHRQRYRQIVDIIGRHGLGFMVGAHRPEDLIPFGKSTSSSHSAHLTTRPEHLRLALEELEFFTSYLRVLGVYPASPFRAELARKLDPAQSD